MTEDYVSFEVAKLLKEKGFDYQGFDYIDFEGEVIRQDRPTHQMAMKWLREKYDLPIIVFPYKANNEKKWCCKVYKTFNLLGYEEYINETLSSYEEAVEAALKYALENLI